MHFMMQHDQSLQNEDFNDGLVHALHDAARIFELSIKEQSSLSRISWFSAAWLGVDMNAWAKGLSYQADPFTGEKHSLVSGGTADVRESHILGLRFICCFRPQMKSLHVVMEEIGIPIFLFREGDVTLTFVNISCFLRLSAPLDSIIKEKLSAKQPELSGWLWSEQIPVVMTTFINHFERDARFSAATVSGKMISSGAGTSSDVSLLMLSLTYCCNH
ncbi:hypothetical protein AKJ16_DCAP11780 [Drosera capensis]